MLVSSYLILPLCGLLSSSSFPFFPSSSLSPPSSLLRVQLRSLCTLSQCPAIERHYQIFADCFKFHYWNYLLSLLCFTLHWPHFLKSTCTSHPFHLYPYLNLVFLAHRELHLNFAQLFSVGHLNFSRPLIYPSSVLLPWCRHSNQAHVSTIFLPRIPGIILSLGFWLC